MLNIIRLSFKILAFGYSDFSSLIVFQFDFWISRYQVLSCSSQSPCFSQKSRNVPL